MNHIKWLWQLWRNHKGFIVLLFVITLLSAGVTVVYPLIFRDLIDTVSDVLLYPDKYPSPQQEIYKIVYILIGVGLIKLIAGLYPAFRAMMNMVFEYVLRKRYFSTILEKDFAFFNQYRTGDLVTRLTDDLSDFPKICWFACSGIFRALESFSKILFCIIAMIYLSWQLTLLSIAPIPFMILIFYVTSEKLYTRFRKNQEAISDINSQLELSFSGIRIIKAFASESKYMRFFDNALGHRFNTEMNVVKLNTMLHLIYQYIDRFAQIGIVIFGGYMVVKGTISIGTFFAFYTYLALLIYPILDLPQLFVSGKQAFVNIDRLEEIKNYPTTYRENRNKKRVAHIENIKFNNVSFCYNESECILNNVDFDVKRGEKTVIIGPVGSGKTTILGLLTGMLKPTKGDISINGIPLNDINHNAFRDTIGYVPQEPLLFSGTVKDNVVFGTGDIEDKLYERVIKAVQMENEIRQFKHGDETIVGQRGVSLSGGQKQRIAIARALIRQPEILILDDITASLDTDNEQKLWNEINKIYSDITCFIVSNRLSTLRYVDNVIFLDSGRLVGKGSHEDMLGIYPQYRTFVEEHYLEA